MKLSAMRDLLSARGIQLTKSLGQNFLHDRNQLERIVALGEIQPGNRVLEIGPGLGPLTEVLLEAGAEVFAIEKDRRLVTVLQERFDSNASFDLLTADALAYLKENPRDWGDWKLVSNLPYSVGSPILVELALAPQPPERLVATLQLEVIQRIMATAGEADYGQLSLFLQLRYQPIQSFKIPASCFFPPPDVDSGCVLLLRRKTPLLEPELAPLFFRVVKRAFSERRKMIPKLLKQDYPAEKLEAVLAQAGVSPQARAETVSLEQFAQITRSLAKT